ncbi:unnamed protein product [Clavelina lepadiformis]|uniref:Uncharacterized protein n=1 Tax=Clavelina lepadiformis TaxID=159417 RepID=A0ABP0G0Y6_CLALP
MKIHNLHYMNKRYSDVPLTDGERLSFTFQSNDEKRTPTLGHARVISNFDGQSMVIGFSPSIPG